VNFATVFWDYDVARVMQLLYCEALKNGAVMRYAKAVESTETNRKLEQLERNLEQWQSKQR